MDYILQTHALEKSYGHFKALKGLSMKVPKGSIYGFIGKNGAGKTTLIRILCGLQRPTAGGYALFGRKHSDRNIVKSRRRMAAIVETPSIFPELSATENLIQQHRILGLPSYEGLEEILRLTGLSSAGRKKAGHFSLGMRQRLGIAVALVGDPDFLALDEPVNGLDPQGIIEVRELILTLNRERQITFLISSHILDELSRIATHYGFIDSGRLVKEISKESLDASCRKCLRIEVSDTKALARILDQEQLEYKILSQTKADVFDQITVSKLALSLAKEGCDVLSMQERNESLESYYLNLLGGGGHA